MISFHHNTPLPQTLDTSADGYARAEACRVVLLGSADTMLVNATPLALLSSSAVNSNGTASTLTAPHGPSQQSLLRDALAGSRSITLAALQLHANGTQLGDAVEVNAALSVLLPYAAQVSSWALSNSHKSRVPSSYQAPLLLHTCKGHSGHQEAASGLASLQEAIALMQHQQAAPALHLHTLNPHVQGALYRCNRGVIIARQGPQPLTSQAAVGVSSFGAQGTNAHAMLLMPEARSLHDSHTPVHWQTRRCWVMPPVQVYHSCWVIVAPAHTPNQALLQRMANATPSRVVFATRMKHPSLAHLQTSVLTGQQHMVPNSVWLAMATSAMHVLHHDGACCLADLSLSRRPVLLQPTRPPGASNVSLNVAVDLDSGRITVTRQTVTLLTGQIVCSLEDKWHKNLLLLSTIPPPSSGAVACVAPSMLCDAILPPAVLEAGLQLVGGHLPINVDSLAVTTSQQQQQQQQVSNHVTALPLAVRWSTGNATGIRCGPLPTPVSRVSSEGTSPEPVSFAQALGSAPTPSAPDARVANRLAALQAMAPADRSRVLKSQVFFVLVLFRMDTCQLELTVLQQMMRAVYDLLGEMVHPDQPLMAAGLDSRGAMELRGALQEQLGIEVPTTMLYDAQTVSEAVDYLQHLLVGAVQQAAAAPTTAAPVAPRRAGVQLLKALRYAAQGYFFVHSCCSRHSNTPAPRPLFLIAPGIANAQAAYFAFAQV